MGVAGRVDQRLFAAVIFDFRRAACAKRGPKTGRTAPIRLLRVFQTRSPQTSLPFSRGDRDISPSGIGLLHRTPLDAGEVGVKIPAATGGWRDILIHIRWRRANEDGWYLSGGTFVPLVMEELSALLL